jgi:hypothetical protein
MEPVLQDAGAPLPPLRHLDASTCVEFASSFGLIREKSSLAAAEEKYHIEDGEDGYEDFQDE